MIDMILRFFVIFFVFATFSFGATPPFVSFSLDSGMGVNPYRNRSLADVTLIAHDATNMAYWYSNRQLSYTNNKLGFYMRAFLTGLIINRSYFLLYSLPYKEFGYASRGRAFGVDPQYYLNGDLNDSVDTYYAFVGKILGNLGGGEVSTAIVPPAISELSVPESVDTSDFHLIWYSGGVNNEVFLSQLIDDRFYTRQTTSVYDLLGFFTSKMAISYMDDAQIHPIQSRYQYKGIDVSYSDLRRYNGYAVLSSLTFWAFIDGWSRYLVGGIDYIRYNEYKNIRLPDVCMYLTSHGPSYRVQSGYRLSSNMHIPVAVEYVFKGNNVTEITLGMSKKWSWPLKSYSEIRFGKGVGLSQSLDVVLPFFQKIRFGMDYYNVKNLYGERHIPSLKNGDTNLNFWIGYSYRQ